MTSAASLATPGNKENWVEKTAKDGGGGLPPGVRKVARALKRKHPEWPLSRCVATAWSMSKKWAAAGSAKGARNVAQLTALQARNKARQTAEVAAAHPADRAAVLELSHAVLLELARIVRTEAGARKYGVPIGSVIGQRGPHARVRGGVAKEAKSTAGRVAVAEQGLAEATDRVIASGQTGKSRKEVAAAKARVASAGEAGQPSVGSAWAARDADTAWAKGNRAQLAGHLGQLGLRPGDADVMAGQLLSMDRAKARKRVDVLVARSELAKLDQRRRRGHVSLADHARQRKTLQRRLGAAQGALQAA